MAMDAAPEHVFAGNAKPAPGHALLQCLQGLSPHNRQATGWKAQVKKLCQHDSSPLLTIQPACAGQWQRLLPPAHAHFGCYKHCSHAPAVAWATRSMAQA